MATSTFNMITGEGGETLTGKWTKGGTRIFGLHSQGFPNLMIMSGPQAAAASSTLSGPSIPRRIVVWMLSEMRRRGQDR